MKASPKRFLQFSLLASQNPVCASSTNDPFFIDRSFRLVGMKRVANTKLRVTTQDLGKTSGYSDSSSLCRDATYRVSTFSQRRTRCTLPHPQDLRRVAPYHRGEPAARSGSMSQPRNHSRCTHLAPCPEPRRSPPCQIPACP